MAQQRLPAVRLVAGHFQVLGSDAVADGTGLFHAARVDQRAPVIERLGDDGGARHGGQQAVDSFLHRVDVGRVRAQQDALRQLVVLGLAEKVHRHPVGGRRAVRQHQDF